ncbi:MAG: hypothetical protein Fur0041_12860 [Bacteroidia bacterium]
MMKELINLLVFLTTWFVIPYFAGNWLFGQLKKKWKFLGAASGVAKIFSYGVFLMCALTAWMLVMLVITGIKMML